MHSKHEGTNMKCTPKCAPSETLSKTGLASCSGGILAAGSTGECWHTRRDPLTSYSGILSGILGGIHWRTAGELLCDTQWDTRRDPLVSRSGGILGEIHWRAALAGYWAGSTGEQLWWDTRRDTRRDPLVSCSGGILGRGVV